MKMALAAVIEAIFAVLGKPDLERRQCPLAMDKWLNLIVAEHQLALGLIWNIRRLTIAIPREYLDNTLHVLKTVWPKDRQEKGRKCFFALEALKMAGKFGQLMEAAPFARYWNSFFFTSIVFALVQNRMTLLDSSPEF